jgi:fructose-1,6-bisphosphatase I
MAGYCLYGGCTQMIIAKKEVSMYQLIDSNFKLIQNNLIYPPKGNIFSINESNKYIWSDNRYNQLMNNLIKENYSMRWVGSMVADAHRTLIKGGIFSYPANNKNKQGKIRLLYEAYPFAYIFNKANGKSSNGRQDILDIDFPNNIHQKIPIILSSDYEFNLFNKL